MPGDGEGSQGGTTGTRSAPQQAATLRATAGQRAERASEPGTPRGANAGAIPEPDDHERQNALNLSASARTGQSAETRGRSGGGSSQKEARRRRTATVTRRSRRPGFAFAKRVLLLARELPGQDRSPDGLRLEVGHLSSQLIRARVFVRRRSGTEARSYFGVLIQRRQPDELAHQLPHRPVLQRAPPEVLPAPRMPVTS